MRAFVTSIGEKTTKFCCDQLKKFGFEVVLLDKKESWIEKYKRFILAAEDDCFRVDADTIVNKNIIKIRNDFEKYEHKAFMCSFKGWDFYKNDVGVIGCMFYSKKGLEIIKNNINNLQTNRPETSAWRLPEMVEYTYSDDAIVGIHGVGQDVATIERAIKNKTDRGQIQDYDFELAKKLSINIQSYA